MAANKEKKRAQMQKAVDMLARAQTLNEEDVYGALQNFSLNVQKKN